MKKALALMLALMMVLSLAACGGKDDKQPSGSNDNPGTSQQSEQNTDDNTSKENAEPTGVEWQDNYLTEEVFKPDWKIASNNYVEMFHSMTVTFKDVTKDEVIAYCDALKSDYGFERIVPDEGGDTSFESSLSNGIVNVTITWKDGKNTELYIELTANGKEIKGIE